MFGVVLLQPFEPPVGQVVAAFRALQRLLHQAVALAQEAAEQGVGEGFVLAFADFAGGAHGFVYHGMGGVAAVGELVEGGQYQAADVGAGQGFVQHQAEQGAQAT